MIVTASVLKNLELFKEMFAKKAAAASAAANGGPASSNPPLTSQALSTKGGLAKQPKVKKGPQSIANSRAASQVGTAATKPHMKPAKPPKRVPI